MWDIKFPYIFCHMLLSVAGVEECVKNTLKSFHVLKSPSVDFSNHALFNKICHRNPIFCELRCRVHSELTVLVFLCFSLKKVSNSRCQGALCPNFLIYSRKKFSFPSKLIAFLLHLFQLCLRRWFYHTWHLYSLVSLLFWNYHQAASWFSVWGILL